MASYLLAENSDRFLTEDGLDLIVLESSEPTTGEFQLSIRRRRGRGGWILPLLYHLWELLGGNVLGKL